VSISLFMVAGGGGVGEFIMRLWLGVLCFFFPFDITEY